MGLHSETYRVSLTGAWRLLSISFDGAHDHPAALRAVIGKDGDGFEGGGGGDAGKKVPQSKLTKSECIQYADSLIRDSFGNWRTKVYDKYQYCCQGIF